mgnify:FL=1
MNRSIWKNLKSTYKYAKKGKKYLGFFLIGNILITIFSIIVPLIVARRLILLTSGLFQKLLIVSFAIFLCEIIINVIVYFTNYVYNMFYYDVHKNLQIELIRETLKITQNDLNTHSSGVFIERINNDTNNVTEIFTETIDYLIKIVGNIGILVSICFINIYLGLVYIIYIIVIVFYNKYSSNINYKNRDKWKDSMEKIEGFSSEIVRGAKDIKILNAEESFLDRAKVYMSETNDIDYKFQCDKYKLRLLGNSIKDGYDLLIAVIIYVLLVSNMISVEYVLIIYSYHNKVKNAANDIEYLIETLKQFNLAANRIFGILEGNEFSKECFGSGRLKKMEGNIEFKNVCFQYEDNVPILKNMNFKINANEVVGFVGPSGGGKSTIFNLISALYRPSKGIITFDDIDINTLDKSSIRGNLSVISQNAYIFNMSIMDNLKVVKKGAKEKEIKEACRLACLDEFIESLPNKYDTIVGEGGVTLSGGQRQRLAIARALLLKTEVLLFDEATSALDNETQTKIQDAINNLKGEYTILIIAHRLSTIIDANKIFVINDGKVEAVGKHDELLKISKTYQKLYKKEISKKDDDKFA